MTQSTKSKTIRISEQTYQELADYRSELERINDQSVSLDEAIDLLFGEVCGLEYELASERQKRCKAKVEGKTQVTVGETG